MTDKETAEALAEFIWANNVVCDQGEADIFYWQEGSEKSIGVDELIHQALTKVREDEREACAKVCEEEGDELLEDSLEWYAAEECGKAIRERGEG